MKTSVIVKRYSVAIVALIVLVGFIMVFPDLAPKAESNLLDQTKTMFWVVPPIFLLLGLLDVWVPKETLIKYMGKESGVKGVLLAFALGSAAAGPLYGAFPVAAVLMKKGASFSNILIFIGSWSTTKIPMFLFEMQALGKRFAIARLLIDILGIILIALAMKLLIPKKEVKRLYSVAETL